MLADAGQKVVTATLNKDPWNHQCFDAYEDMIRWTKRADGTWEYDYSLFDRWVGLCAEEGIDRQINCYSMLPWNNELHYYDAAADRIVEVRANPGTVSYTHLDVYKRQLPAGTGGVERTAPHGLSPLLPRGGQ